MSQADAWAAGASSSFTLLDFELQYSPAHEDEIIHVVGEDGALGCWNPINSVELVRAEGGEALWRPRAPVSVPSGAPVEYKYIVFRSGRLHRWEAFDGNRIVVPEGDHQAARRDVMDVLPPPRPASASAAALASMHIAGATAAAAPLPPVQDTSEQSAGDDDDVYAQAPTPAAMPRAASSTASELASTVGGADPPFPAAQRANATGGAAAPERRGAGGPRDARRLGCGGGNTVAHSGTACPSCDCRLITIKFP